MRQRGFTLLEVMVAMAILALGLTTVLSSQTGLFATTRRVQAETEAANLVRCKMSEIELELLRLGYSLMDQRDEGACCDDEGSDEFRCEWSIDTIELPQPPPMNLGDQDDLNPDDKDSADTAGLTDPMGLPTSELGAVSSMGDLAGTLAPTTGGGGIIGMALSMVYPTLKPMLEASIRKVTVRVIWDEGTKKRSLDVIQYVANPMEGSLNPNAADGLADLMNGSLGAGTGQGAPGASSGTPGSSPTGNPSGRGAGSR